MQIKHMLKNAAKWLQAFELRLWPHQHPLRQFEGILAQELLFKMEDRGLWMERLEVTPAVF